MAHAAIPHRGRNTIFGPKYKQTPDMLLQRRLCLMLCPAATYPPDGRILHGREGAADGPDKEELQPPPPGDQGPSQKVG